MPTRCVLRRRKSAVCSTPDISRHMPIGSEQFIRSKHMALIIGSSSVVSLPCWVAARAVRSGDALIDSMAIQSARVAGVPHSLGLLSHSKAARSAWRLTSASQCRLPFCDYTSFAEWCYVVLVLVNWQFGILSFVSQRCDFRQSTRDVQNSAV